MKRFTKPGEGALLGTVLCILLIVGTVTVFLNMPRTITIKPVHDVSIIVTPEPRVNINTATAETLAGLNGIGEVLAERIVEWREENGAFETVDAILSVSGIGEAKLEAIRDRICVD